MTKLDKKLREVIKLDELEIDGYVSDKILSQIKQVVLKEIIKEIHKQDCQYCRYKDCNKALGAIESLIKNLLTDIDRNLK